MLRIKETQSQVNQLSYLFTDKPNFFSFPDFFHISSLFNSTSDKTSTPMWRIFEYAKLSYTPCHRRPSWQEKNM